MNSGSKTCRVCKAVKALSEYTRNRDRADGLSNLCKPCDQAKGRAWYAANQARRAETQKAWSLANKPKVAGHVASYKARHPDRIAAYKATRADQTQAYQRDYHLRNLEENRAKRRAWSKKNPEAHLKLCQRRNRHIKHARVAWADVGAMDAIYAEARRLTRETGVPHEVDHIVPLRGKTVCGLHVETNLQILTRTQNRRKSKRLEGGVG